MEANRTEQYPIEPPPENVEELLEAARYDDIDDLVRLASSGVSLDSKDLQGRTALHMAAANGHLGIVEYLIGNGVDINASNIEKNTPLHWACLNGYVEVVKKLVLSGANLSLLNSHERTPVDEAVGNGKMDVIDAINTSVAELELTGIYVNKNYVVPFAPISGKHPIYALAKPSDAYEGIKASNGSCDNTILSYVGSFSLVTLQNQTAPVIILFYPMLGAFHWLAEGSAGR